MGEFSEKPRGRSSCRGHGRYWISGAADLLDLLPTRLPFPITSTGVSAVTIVLIAGMTVGVVLYLALLRWVDWET